MPSHVVISAFCRQCAQERVLPSTSSYFQHLSIQSSFLQVIDRQGIRPTDTSDTAERGESQISELFAFRGQWIPLARSTARGRQ
jgi:hypothetical protein